MKRKTRKKLVSVLLTLIIILGQISTVFGAVTAEDDVTGHWAEESIRYWQDQSLIAGYSDGTFRPDEDISKAEIITLINRIYGYYETLDDNYSDVSDTDWYANDTAIAKANHYMDWYEEEALNPDVKITRQEVCAVLASILQLEGSDTTAVLEGFEDSDSIADWARSYVGAMVSEGYLNGYEDNALRVEETITRGEVVVLLDRVMGQLINAAGTYGEADATLVEIITGNVTVNTWDVVLSNMVIEGDLILAAGIADGNVDLNYVTVEGETIIYGGGTDCITFVGCELNEIIVYRLNGNVKVISKDSELGQTLMLSGGELEGEFADVEILGEGQEVVLDGDYDSITIETATNVSVTDDTAIGSLEITDSGSGSTVDVEEDAQIEQVTFNGEAKVTGSGTVNEAVVNVDNVEIEQEVNELEVADGVDDSDIDVAVVDDSTDDEDNGDEDDDEDDEEDEDEDDEEEDNDDEEEDNDDEEEDNDDEEEDNDNDEEDNITDGEETATLSSEKSIISTTIGSVDDSGNLINIPYGTTVSELETAITISTSATFEVLESSDGSTVTDKDTTDVTEDMVIEVTAEDSTTAEYTITIKEDGTVAYPFGVWTIEDLVSVGAGTDSWDASESYMLMSDLDFTDDNSYSDSSNKTMYSVFAASVIGEFSGSFDGNDKIISNLTISVSEQDNVGLFYIITSEGSVENLGLTNVDIDNEISGSIDENSYSGVGVITGYNAGIIDSCYSTGTVDSDYIAGGIVGLNQGSVSNCYSTGTITSDYIAGGIAGTNYSGKINNCYSTGTIAGSMVGGIVGLDYSGIINECHSTGAISSSYRTGGIAGSTMGGTIEECYSTGVISSYFDGDDAKYDSAGGIVGINYSGTIKTCYSTATISSENGAGGISGSENDEAITENCYYVDAPTNNSIDVASSIDLILVFDQAVQGIDGKYVTIYTSDDELEAKIEVTNTSKVTIDNSTYTATIDLTDDFDYMTEYYVLLDEGAIQNTADDYTYSGISLDTMWSFITRAISSENSITATTIGSVDDSGNLIDIPNGTKVSELETAITVSINAALEILESSDGSVVTDKDTTDVTDDMVVKVTAEDATSAEYTITIKEDGTVAYPYGVWSIEDLVSVGTGTDEWTSSDAYILMSDLDFTSDDSYSDVSNKTTYSSFTTNVIGEFSGSFNGNSKTISNLTISNSEQTDIGLFYTISETGSVENLGIIDANILGNYYVGAITSYNQGTINNCYSTGSITANYEVGGIAGDNAGTIKNSYSNSTVTSLTYGYAGGIAGYSWGTIDACYSMGTTGSMGSGSIGEIGGIVGYNDTEGTVKNSYSTGSVIGDYDLGGLVGYNAGTIESCYNTGTIQDGGSSGGIAGYNEGTVQYSYNTGALVHIIPLDGTERTIYHYAEIVGDNEGTVESCYYAEQPVNGIEGIMTSANLLLTFNETIEVVEGKSIEIYKANDSELVTKIVLTDDTQVMVSNDTDNDIYKVQINPTEDLDYETEYYVLLDDGAVINSSDSYAYTGIALDTSWLFTTEAASDEKAITSFTLDEQTDAATIDTDNQTVTIEVAYGTDVTSLTPTIVITGESISPASGVEVDFTNTVIYTVTAADETTSEWEVTVTVAAAGIEEVSIGDVDTSENIVYVPTNTTVSELEAAITVTDNTTFEILESTGGDAVTDKETTMMTETMVIKVTFDEGSKEYTITIKEDGTDEYPYGIWTIEDLVKVGSETDSWGASDAYILMSDLDFASEDSYSDSSNKATYASFTDSVIDEFSGSFDGNNKVISNLTISNSADEYVGLFWSITSTGSIENLGVTAVDIDGYRVGAIAGYNYGTITESYSSGTINASSRAGGIAASNYGTITESYSTGTIYGDGQTGGIAGYSNGTVTQCYSTGSISSGDQAGGIIGYNYGTITESYSTGTISGIAVGGIAGYILDGTITESYSTGTISGTNYAGGIVGYIINGTITGNYSTGSISGSGNIGRIFGYDQNGNGTIENCYYVDSPINETTDVTTSASLTLVFDEAVQGVDGKSITIYTTDGAIVADIEVTDTDQVTIDDDTYTVTINSIEDFDYDTEYYVLIDEGAIINQDESYEYSGITDETSWTFTTEEATP